MRPLHDEIVANELAVDFVEPEKILLPVAVRTNFAVVVPLRKDVPPDLKDEHALIGGGRARQRAVIQVAQLCGFNSSVLAKKNPRVADSRQIFAPKFFAVTPLLVLARRGDELEKNVQIFFAQPPTKNFAELRFDGIPTKTLVPETRIVEPLQHFNLRGQFDVRTEEMFQRGVNELQRQRIARRVRRNEVHLPQNVLRAVEGDFGLVNYERQAPQFTPREVVVPAQKFRKQSVQEIERRGGSFRLFGVSVESFNQLVVDYS